MFDGFLLLAPLILALLVGLFAFVGCSVDRSGLAEVVDVHFRVLLDTDIVPDVTAFRVFITVREEPGGSPISNRGEAAEVRDGRYVIDDFDPVTLIEGVLHMTCEVFDESDSGGVPPTGVEPLIEGSCTALLEDLEEIGVRFESRSARFGDGYELICRTE